MNTKKLAPIIIQNPGMQELEKIILQLYQQRLINRQDIVEFVNSLNTIVDDIPDKPKYLN